MAVDTLNESPGVTQAAERLDKAVTALEGRMRALKAKPPEDTDDLFARAPAAGQVELDAYGKALEDAAQQASAALGRAAEELRAILNGEG
jgi:hypothetical protein